MDDITCESGDDCQVNNWSWPTMTLYNLISIFAFHFYKRWYGKMPNIQSFSDDAVVGHGLIDNSDDYLSKRHYIVVSDTAEEGSPNDVK